MNNCGTVSGAVLLGDNTELFTTPSVFSLANASATAGGGAASPFTSSAPDVFNNLAGGLLRSSLVDLGSDGHAHQQRVDRGRWGGNRRHHPDHR